MRKQAPWSSDQASIDPTFNVIRPRGVILQRDLPAISGMAPWPRSMLQPFMHEITHHWCFRGAVGNVLAAMNLRSCETAIFGGDASEFIRAVGDHLDFRAIMEFLRPLAEGMALFAEFDTRPGRSSVISDPQQFAWIACATNEMSTERDVSAATNEALRAVRRSKEGAARKIGVLKHPIGALGQAYFDGYLMVKSLYRELRRQIPPADDPDWFLCFLRDYIFADPGLVVRLLSDPPDGLCRYDVVIRYVGERLWTLSRTTEARAAAYEAHCNQPPNTLLSVWPAGIQTAPDDEVQATALLDEFLRWHVEKCSHERGLWRQGVTELLERRPIAMAAAEEIPLRVRDGFVETTFTSPTGVMLFRSGSLDPGEPDCDSVGWAGVFLRLGRDPFIASALGDQAHILAIRVRTGQDEQAIQSMLTDRGFTPPALSTLMELVSEGHQRLRREFEDRLGPSHVEDHARGEAKRLADVFINMLSSDWMYGWETQPISTARRGRPAETFKNGGLWALFAPHAQMMELYVRASVGAKLSPSQRNDLFAFTETIEERCGIRLIEREGDKLRFVI